MRKRKAALGATTRRHERTGVVEVDSNVVDDAVRAVLKTSFRRCVAGEPELKATRKEFAADVKIRRIDTGVDVPVTIDVEPDAKARSHVHGRHELTLGPRGQRNDRVVLNPNARICMDKAEWGPHLREILVHELTHAADATLPTGRIRPVDGKNLCAYLNQPHEVAAFLAQVRNELTTFRKTHEISELRRQGNMRRPEDLLARSEIYARMDACLSTKNKRRFQRLAADLWDKRYRSL